MAQSIADTAEHFLEGYGKRVRSFIYDSKALHNLESFSSDSGINVMIINVQAFNARARMPAVFTRSWTTSSPAVRLM